MRGHLRTVELDFDQDTTRWELADQVAWRCKHCGLILMVSVTPADLHLHPILFCGPCWDKRNRRSEMLPVDDRPTDQG